MKGSDCMNRYLIKLPYQNEFLIISNVENLYEDLTLKYGRYTSICYEDIIIHNTIKAYLSETCFNSTLKLGMLDCSTSTPPERI